jgi:undecaprenyl-diphosphatase
MRLTLCAFFSIFLLGDFYSQDLDFKVLREINQKEYPQWDKTMKITSHSVYPVMIGVPAGVFLSGYINDDKLMMRNGIKAGAAIGLGVLVSGGLKLSINRKRPYEQYPIDIIKRTNSGPHSFPSGHTTAAFASATALTLSTKKWYVAIPSYLYACGVGYSRIRLGVHFPSDVLGGIVIGIGSGLLVWQIDQWIQKAN